MPAQQVTLEVPAGDLETRRLLSLVAEQAQPDQPIKFEEGQRLRVVSGGPALLNINAVCRFIAGSGHLGKDLLGRSPAAEAQVRAVLKAQPRRLDRQVTFSEDRRMAFLYSHKHQALDGQEP